ncbi:MAG: hypothetical protein RH917_16945 [Lacipirellulaceae bacterium]
MLAILMVASGILLATSADRIARGTKLGGTLVGFFLLAAATSLPELVIDCNAARIRAPNLAVGDLLGSSIFNLLILGIIDLAHRSPVRILSPVCAAHALSATTSIALTGIVLLGILSPFEKEFLGIGLGLWAVAIVYLFSVRLIFIDQYLARKAESGVEEISSEKAPPVKQSLFLFCLGGAVVFVGAPHLARTADSLAHETGLGGTFVGTILVALTTSLPEIVTTLAAVRLGAYELAAGNVFGSNCFNVAILPIVDAFYEPGSLLKAIDPFHSVTAGFIVVITSLAAMSLLYRPEKRFWLFEPDALLIVCLSVTALVAIGYISG